MMEMDYVEPDFKPLKVDVDMVNHPPHYRGPKVVCPNCSKPYTLECISVIRSIRDMRLANAIKYLWRVAFGGKLDTNPKEDVRKAVWYSNDYVENDV